VLRELLAQDDANLWALGELTEVSEAAGTTGDVRLLVSAVNSARTRPACEALRRKAAEIAKTRQCRSARQAIALYEQLFEDELSDSDGRRRVAQVYESAIATNDLSRLLERLIELAESPSARSTLRLELAKLSEERFQALDTASSCCARARRRGLVAAMRSWRSANCTRRRSETRACRAIVFADQRGQGSRRRGGRAELSGSTGEVYRFTPRRPRACHRYLSSRSRRDSRIRAHSKRWRVCWQSENRLLERPRSSINCSA